MVLTSMAGKRMERRRRHWLSSGLLQEFRNMLLSSGILPVHLGTRLTMSLVEVDGANYKCTSSDERISGYASTAFLAQKYEVHYQINLEAPRKLLPYLYPKSRPRFFCGLGLIPTACKMGFRTRITFTRWINAWKKYLRTWKECNIFASRN